MWVSKDRKVTLHAPADYNRSLIPGGYYITPGVARIPLDCHNGVALAFTESNKPRNVPANLVMEFSDQTIAANGWSLPRLVEICKAVIGSFAPDYATLHDEAHRARPGYDERLFDYDMRRVPTGLYWLTYYSRDWVANLGEERLRKLSSHVAMEQWLPDGGVLIALQEESYDETNPAHKDRQLYLEQEIFDLGIQARFPNPGL